jgi:hypothetical protein
MEHSYWKKQTSTNPLFPDVIWSKPERRDQAGRLGIIGGNKLGFAGAAEAYAVTESLGVGRVRVILPDALKRAIPTTITDTIFSASNPSGSLARDALSTMLATGEWAGGILLSGDAGRNSETALVYDDFIREYSGQLTLTRDTIDLMRNSPQLILERPETLLVASFAQIQKLFQAVYYPKMLTFSMNLTMLVEALHKFTITYPAHLMVFHRETMLVASNGQITTQVWEEPLRIWRGETAARAASYWLWNPTKPLEAFTASLLKD